MCFSQYLNSSSSIVVPITYFCYCGCDYSRTDDDDCPPRDSFEVSSRNPVGPHSEPHRVRAILQNAGQRLQTGDCVPSWPLPVLVKWVDPQRGNNSQWCAEYSDELLEPHCHCCCCCGGGGGGMTLLKLCTAL